MPPAKERGKTDASLSKSSKSKGKQRAIDQDEILDVDAFVRRQVKALNAPLRPLDRSTYYTEDADGKETDPPQQKTLDKAVKAVKCVPTFVGATVYADRPAAPSLKELAERNMETRLYELS